MAATSLFMSPTLATRLTPTSPQPHRSGASRRYEIQLSGSARLFLSRVAPHLAESGAVTRIAPTRLEGVYTSQYGENKNRAEQFYGDLVGLGMALHHRVSAPDFLEGCPRDCIVAVLSWYVVQLAAALIRIRHFMNGIMAPVWQGSDQRVRT